jgi:hypothetical protein
MARTLTNNLSMAYAIQQSFGVLGASPAWKQIEPNTVSAFGPQIATVPRDPISANRQRRKGTITDLDSTVEFEADLTLDSFLDFIEGFVFVTATNDRLISGALRDTLIADATLPVLTTEGYTHSAGVTIPVGQLVFTRGFNGNAINNGLKEVTNSNATEVEVDGGASGILDEDPGNAGFASLETAGWRFTDLAWDDTAKTLTSALTDPSTIGLTLGQLIYIGGPTGSERFPNGTAWARVVAIGSGVGTPITVDKITNDLGTPGLDGGGNEVAAAVDLLFGLFIRNVPISSAEFLERYFQFEAGWPQLFETEPPTPVADPDGFEYALDNLANQLTWNMPGQDKATATFAFVGTDTEPPVDNASRKTNADTPAVPVQTTAFNTSADFARLRITDVDETGLTTDLTEMTATLNNNVTPEKVLGFLGGRFLNFGNFEVDIETVALFSSPNVIARIRGNTTVTMDWIVENDDGVIATDIPSMTLGNGGRDLPVNESVKVNLTGQAFLDPILGTSIGVSIIPFVPAA